MNCKTLYINNTLISRYIRQGIYEKKIELETEKATISYSLVADDKAKKLTYIDMMIADAAYSFYKTDQSFFTPAMILRVLSGNDTQTCTTKTARVIEESLKRLSSFKISIECSEQMKTRGLKYDPDEYKDVAFFTFKKIEGANYTQYAPSRLPLWSYAEKLNQMIAVPTKLLGCNGIGETRQSLENIAIKHYLIHRLEIAFYKGKSRNRNPRNKMASIYYYHIPHEKGADKYTGMLFDLNIADGNESRTELAKLKHITHKNVKKTIKDFMKPTVKYLEEEPKEIKGDGREIVGIRIVGKKRELKEFED